MSQKESETLESLNLEVERLSVAVAKLSKALGTLITWQARDLGTAGVKQLLEMIE